VLDPPPGQSFGSFLPGRDPARERLEEHEIVERYHDPTDRRVVLVDYAPGMQDIARKIMERRRRGLKRAVEKLTEEESRVLLKGLKLLVESFERAQGEPA
jgi:DNA-binding MarR family transcriptional regulator